MHLKRQKRSGGTTAKYLGYGPFKSAVKLYVHYYTFGQTLIDKIAISNGLSRKYEYEFDNYDKFVELLNRGSVTVIGAHVGCWEAGTVFFGDYASRLNIVMYDGEYRKIKNALSACGAGYKVIPVNDGGIEPLLRIKQAVDNGEYICFQGDRYIDERNTCQVDFMGGKARFPEGPFLIASKFGTPVIIYFAIRNSGMKYRFKFTVIKPGLTRDEILEKYVASLEAIVRQYPQQWFNFFDLWQQK